MAAANDAPLMLHHNQWAHASVLCCAVVGRAACGGCQASGGSGRVLPVSDMRLLHSSVLTNSVYSVCTSVPSHQHPCVIEMIL